MSKRRNSILISAERVCVEHVPNFAGLTITIMSPSSDDLIRLIADAGQLLEIRRRRGEAIPTHKHTTL